MSARKTSIPDFSRGVDGLLPAIAQDADNGEVLMLAWMNHEAYQATQQTREATYYSRSRGELWCKGKTSGHVQEVVDVRVDCDADAILVRVRQRGAACHNGYRSCFYRTLACDGRLETNQPRQVDPAEIYGKPSHE